MGALFAPFIGMIKTNAMRMLEKAHVPYTPHFYPPEVTDGEAVAALLGQDAATVFKTLVTLANTRENLVFVVPVCRTLDLKKAARAAGVKSVEMLKQKELLPTTGYVHGGCSPIGMKKRFRTFLDGSAQDLPRIFFSGGHVGVQVELSPQSLSALLDVTFADLV